MSHMIIIWGLVATISFFQIAYKQIVKVDILITGALITVKFGVMIPFVSAVFTYCF